MNVLPLALVIIGALFVIASGIWVAVALGRVVCSRRSAPEPDPSVSE